MSKKIVIVGGTSDLGIALAHEYAASYKTNLTLILAGRNQELLNAIGKDISIRYESNVIALPLEVTDNASISTFINSLDGNIDVCLYLIGFIGSDHTGIQSPAVSDKIIAINFTSVVSIINGIAGKMLQENKKGIIVGVSSVAGERGRQSNFLYGSAKAGMTAYLSGLRNYLFPHGIHVLTVLPGFMQTKMLGDMVTPTLLTTQPRWAARRIIRAVEKQKNIVYVSGIWFFIMSLIKLIPESIFKKMRL